MEDKINHLVKKNFFNNIEIDEKGFGTFHSKENQLNSFLREAKRFKREGDCLYKKNKEEITYCNLYIKSILCYIKGYKLDEKQKSINICHWKGLYKYIKEILSLTEVNKSFLKSCLFAVKFHFLNLEMSFLESVEHLKYLKNEFHSLYLQFNSIENRIPLNELEEFYNCKK